MKKFISLTAMILVSLGAPAAWALVGDTNADGYADTVYIEGDYLKIKDGKTPANIRAYYVGSGTKTLRSLEQLDGDAGLEAIVTVAGQNYLYVVDDNNGYPTKYSIYRNGATGNQDYEIKAVDQTNGTAGNEVVVMFPGDNYIWVINHYAATLNSYLVSSNPSSFTLIDTDGYPGKEIVLGYTPGGSVTIVSANYNSVKSPSVREYHKNVGNGSSQIYGFMDTDGNAGAEIVLLYPGSTSLYVIRDSANPWSYGEDRNFDLYGAFQIMDTSKNRDGAAGNEICYKLTSSNTFRTLNAMTGTVTPVANCN